MLMSAGCMICCQTMSTVAIKRKEAFSLTSAADEMDTFGLLITSRSLYTPGPIRMLSETKGGKAFRASEMVGKDVPGADPVEKGRHRVMIAFKKCEH